jgi:P-type Ca2+ transporter type 2C
MTPLQGTTTGLTSQEALIALRKHGPNTLPATPPTTIWHRFLRQFSSPLIYVLLFALAADVAIWFSEGASGLPVDSIAIAMILLLNAGLGVYQESKSEAAIERLKHMTLPLVWVMRDGRLQHLPAADLVPGDVVRMEAGDRVPADGRLIEAEAAMIDESVVSGESVPVEKGEDDELFSGTLLVRGRVYLEASRTGKESTMGTLALMIGRLEVDPTPLERRLRKFAGQIARVILCLTVVIAIGGLLVEGTQRLSHIFLFAVALAVAAIPEGLPAVLTLTLSLGLERMAKRKAVVRRLSAVEALGSVTVIATDKTGTLTENRMFVKDIDSPHAELALQAAVLANDADRASGAGDPLELALLDYAASRGIAADRLLRNNPRISSRPFTSSLKFMRVTVERNGDAVSFLKGAPEVILERSLLSTEERRLWDEKAEGYAREGFRVLALGQCKGEGDHNIQFLGLVLLWDPPRPEVPEAVRRAQEAGIRVLMVTGDHPATALAVAHEVGIVTGRVLTGKEMEAMTSEELREAIKVTNVYARAAPEDKLRLVDALKQNGEIVAMTGDGVNDAPALKRSDVGVAMGQRGSEVSREVADLVLMDDNFATIVSAVEEGRNIYENIQKFIRFLFSTNLAETLIVVGGAFGAALFGLRDETGAVMLPLTAVQLLWVNLITDGPPALALSLDRDPGVMRREPRDPKSRLLDRESLRFVVATGCLTAGIGGALLVAMPRTGFTLMQTRTAIFLVATIAQLLYVYPARRSRTAGGSNGALHAVVVLCVVLQVLTVVMPSLRSLLGLESVKLETALIVAGAILLSWAGAEAYRFLADRLPAH